MRSKGAQGRIGWMQLIALLAAAGALPCYGQSGGGGAAVPRLYIVSSGPGQVVLAQGGMAQGEQAQGELVRGEIVREIDDPGNGYRWLLMRNDQPPGGPGRMVLIAAHRTVNAGADQRAAGQSGDAVIPPVIRAGERLIVEEHTARVDAVLEARALTPAARGAVFEARLTIGGMVVRAVALGPGRATLEPETGVRP
ncbi:MAG: hypothetical protein ABR906_02965 [Terracidiphilus sp.]